MYIIVAFISSNGDVRRARCVFTVQQQHLQYTTTHIVVQKGSFFNALYEHLLLYGLHMIRFSTLYECRGITGNVDSP